MLVKVPLTPRPMPNTTLCNKMAASMLLRTLLLNECLFIILHPVPPTGETSLLDKHLFYPAVKFIRLLPVIHRFRRFLNGHAAV